MTPADALQLSAIAVGSMMLGLWLLSLWLRDVSIVDIFWGFGFVLIAWVVFLKGTQTPRGWLLVTLTSVWGLRLTGYLAWRNIGKGEDYRYAQMRERHGSKFPMISLFTVFLLQGVVMLVVALPLQTGLTLEATTPLSWLAWVGGTCWLIGLLFEAGGDFQLAAFRANPQNKGQVLQSGFWRYTRHPNYFGDFMVWWGLYLSAFGSGQAWWSAIGPAIMSAFLMKFSGVGLLEKNMKKKPGYEDYIERTNAFFPWFPKSQQEQAAG